MSEIEIRIKIGKSHLEMWSDKHLTEQDAGIIRKWLELIPIGIDLPVYGIKGVTI